jgi:hypothetical protein
MPSVLLEERTRPDFRDVFGVLASQATDIATAVTRVRLSTVDLTAAELTKVGSFRVLVAEVSALQLSAEARGLHSDVRRAPRLDLFRSLLESERLSVRSAPLAGWCPDFTVFSNPEGPFAVLTGFHWFERPYPHRGPALNGVHFGDAARMADRRHGQMWEGAHDIGPAVWNILSKARRYAEVGVHVPG